MHRVVRYLSRNGALAMAASAGVGLGCAQPASLERAEGARRARDPRAAAAVLMLGGRVHDGARRRQGRRSTVGGRRRAVMLDLQLRGKVGRLGMCGTNGKKMPGIRAHMQRNLTDVYEDIDASAIATWPADGVVDRASFRSAVPAFAPGDCAIIFTPDDTHFEIAMACIERGMHVMITKPPVKTLADHQKLAAAARAKGVLCVVEVHKRFDPIYMDARDRIQKLGGFGFYCAYMSQPKHQLDTFRAWAGRSSDISYYLNLAPHRLSRVVCRRRRAADARERELLGRRRERAAQPVRTETRSR